MGCLFGSGSGDGGPAGQGRRQRGKESQGLLVPPCHADAHLGEPSHLPEAPGQPHRRGLGAYRRESDSDSCTVHQRGDVRGRRPRQPALGPSDDAKLRRVRRQVAGQERPVLRLLELLLLPGQVAGVQIAGGGEPQEPQRVFRRLALPAAGPGPERGQMQPLRYGCGLCGLSTLSQTVSLRHLLEHRVRGVRLFAEIAPVRLLQHRGSTRSCS
mmetsp:Transcript_71737/g.201282  ORF Transcript_71737/g.201282 Transcript_71737/m.201282 type:complete len:213 (-) Transcript_71737:599-1237(-)